MQKTWLLLAAQLGLYMLAWLLASVSIRVYQRSALMWSASSGYFCLAVLAAGLSSDMKDSTLLHPLLGMLMTLGFLYIGCAAATFYGLKEWSQKGLWLFSVLVALTVWMLEKYGYGQMRLPFLYLLNGVVLLSMIVRFNAIEVAEFGMVGTWLLHGRGLILAERLNQHAAALNISWGDQQIAVTISIGVAQINETTESLTSLMERVDSALYKAKAEGRNRIVVANSANSMSMTIGTV